MTETPEKPARQPLLQIYMDKALKDAIQEAASRQRMSMTTWAIQAMVAALPDDLAELAAPRLTYKIDHEWSH